MKVKKTTLTLVFVLQLVSNLITAQQRVNVESLVPLSPNAAELGKYGNIPVGLNTGVPDISFPLYEIKSGSLSLPITLSYHASGNQVNQKATDVGLGWSINAGGQISRSVNGIADDRNDSGVGYFNYVAPDINTINSITNNDVLTQYIQDYGIRNTTTAITGMTIVGHDLEPDMFQYSIQGKSGKFIYTKDRTFMSIPFEPIKIEKFLDSANKVCFKITDDNGVFYTFSKYTTTNFLSGYPSDCVSVTSYISTWQLSSIVSANQKDTITFEYETVRIHDEIEKHVKTIGSKFNEGWSNDGSPQPYYNYFLDPVEIVNAENDCSGSGKIKTTKVDYDELRVKKITFKNGYVLFNRSSSNRNDVPPQEVVTNHALENIAMYDANSTLVKKYIFETDYHTAYPTTTESWKNYRLRLKKFYEANLAGTTSNKEYAFEYETTPLPHYGSYNIDYWGYSNGQSNSELIPYAAYDNNSFQSLYLFNLNGNTSVNVVNPHFTNPDTYYTGSANREPSTDYMKAGILKKIIYPTRGYTQFEFEPHQFSSTSSLTFGGGLRVKSIKHFSSAGLLATEEYYKYGANENGLGIKVFDDWLFTKNYEDVVDYYPTSKITNVGIYGTTDGNQFAWRRNFLGISKYSSPSFNGSPVVYETVTKYDSNSGTNGKTVSRFDFNPSHDLIPGMFANSGNYGSINNAWHQGELLEETHYKYANSQYSPVSKTKNEYESYNLKEENAIIFKQVINPIISSYFWLWTYDGYQVLTSGANGTPNLVGSGVSLANLYRSYGFFGVYPYSIKTGAFRKTKETLTTYDPADASKAVDVVTNYLYENELNRYLTKTEKTTSNSDTKISRIKYPQDMTDAVSQAMVTANILAPVLEGKDLLLRNGNSNEEPLSTQQTVYKEIGSLIVKDEVKTFKATNDPELRIKYNEYDPDNGAVRQYTVDGGIPVTIIWGYNKTQPIAEIKNATYSEVSSYVSALQAASDDGSLTESSFSGLRSSLTNAMITTYTYKPLIGVSTITDPKGQTTYYEYDEFNRLEYIKDTDSKVLSKYEYHYRNQ